MRREPASINSDTRLEGEKRVVPPFLKSVLKKDVELTKKFVGHCLNFVQIRSFKNHCKFLEWSCHGVVWLAGLIAFTYIMGNSKLHEMEVNLFVALLIDIFAVAIIKAITRRRRPAINDDPFCIVESQNTESPTLQVDSDTAIQGPDMYSFPSGHASRASMLMLFFIFLYSFPILFWPPLVAWWLAICVSRLLLYRHHILDVLGGIILGFFEAFVMAIIWIGPEASSDFVRWISDERVAGSDADLI